MSMPYLLLVALPSRDVRDGQPLHEGRQVPVVLWPQDQMPMVRHQAIRANPHRLDGQRFLQNILERNVIAVRMEQPHPADPAVQDVKNHSTRSDSVCSWHEGDPNRPPHPLSIMDLSPFMSPELPRS